MEITMRNVKTYRGHEGESLGQCDVYLDGKKAFFFGQGDWGGPSTIEAYSKSPMSVEDFEAWVKGLNLRNEEYDLEIDAELYLEDLLNDLLEERRLKRMCKTKTVLRLKSEPGGISSYNKPCTPEMRAWVVKEHGEDLEEIINLRFAK